MNKPGAPGLYVGNPTGGGRVRCSRLATRLGHGAATEIVGPSGWVERGADVGLRFAIRVSCQSEPDAQAMRVFICSGREAMCPPLTRSSPGGGSRSASHRP